MVTAAAGSDAAVVLVDITKLDWRARPVKLLPQTRRHSLLAQLLRVPSIVFAINKLDAVDADAEAAFDAVREALQAFARQAGIDVAGIVPVSALRGDNATLRSAVWTWYTGPTLLELRRVDLGQGRTPQRVAREQLRQGYRQRQVGWEAARDAQQRDLLGRLRDKHDCALPLRLERHEDPSRADEAGHVQVVLTGGNPCRLNPVRHHRLETLRAGVGCLPDPERSMLVVIRVVPPGNRRVPFALLHATVTKCARTVQEIRDRPGVRVVEVVDMVRMFQIKDSAGVVRRHHQWSGRGREFETPGTFLGGGCFDLPAFFCWFCDDDLVLWQS
jgi:hypothetical protein